MLNDAFLNLSWGVKIFIGLAPVQCLYYVLKLRFKALESIMSWGLRHWNLLCVEVKGIGLIHNDVTQISWPPLSCKYPQFGLYMSQVITKPYSLGVLSWCTGLYLTISNIGLLHGLRSYIAVTQFPSYHNSKRANNL